MVVPIVHDENGCILQVCAFCIWSVYPSNELSVNILIIID